MPKPKAASPRLNRIGRRHSSVAGGIGGGHIEGVLLARLKSVDYAKNRVPTSQRQRGAPGERNFAIPWMRGDGICRDWATAIVFWRSKVNAGRSLAYQRLNVGGRGRWMNYLCLRRNRARGQR